MRFSQHSIRPAFSDLLTSGRHPLPQRFLILLAVFMIAFSFCRLGPAKAASFLETLKPADGFKLQILVEGLPGVRFMALTEKGDVIVSQSGAGRVTLIGFEASGGKPQKIILLKGLDRPHGLTIDGGFLYVAEETEVARYKFDAAQRKITGKRELLFDGMPSGGHSTRTIEKGPDGWFYVSVGSSCNVCIERHKWRAAMLRFQPGSEPEIYSTGLRNTVGYDWHPQTGDLYSVDNGRDWLGDDLPPGEVNKLSKGGFYGWPFFYGDNIRDTKFGGPYDEARHGKPIAPAHKFNAHVAPLSLRFHARLKGAYAATALVAQHGSWNRSVPIGYKVVRLDFDGDGKITQSDFLSGFLTSNGVIGRPVDTLSLADGSILVSDDRNGVLIRMVAE